MKPRIAPPPQREPVALPFHPAVPLVDVAWLLRTRGLGLRWSIPRRKGGTHDLTYAVEASRDLIDWTIPVTLVGTR